MKAKIKKNLFLINYWFDNSWLIMLIFILFCLSFVFAYDSRKLLLDFPLINFIDGFITIFKNPISIVILFLFPMLFISIHTLYQNEKLGANLLRFENKKQYINYLIQSVLKSNTVLFFLLILFLSFAVFCVISPKFLVIYLADYKTLNGLYLIVYLFKIYFIGQWLSIISILLIKIDYSWLIIIMNLFIYYSIFNYSIDENRIISTIFKMPIWIGDYLCMLNYKNYILDLGSFIVFCILLVLLCKGIYEYCSKKVKNIGVL